MTLNELLGDAFREGMTAEEISTALAGLDMVNRSELTAKDNQLAAQKRLLDKATKDLAAERRKSTDAGTENASLLERLNALEERDKANTRLTNISTHKASLIAQGYSEELATATAEALVDGNTAVVLANQGKFLAAQTAKIKEDLMKGTKPPAAGGNSGTARDYDKEIQAAYDNHEFALARALMAAKAKAEQAD